MEDKSFMRYRQIWDYEGNKGIAYDRKRYIGNSDSKINKKSNFNKDWQEYINEFWE